MSESRSDLFADVVAALYGGAAASPCAAAADGLPAPDLSSYPHTHLPEALVENQVALREV